MGGVVCLVGWVVDVCVVRWVSVVDGWVWLDGFLVVGWWSVVLCRPCRSEPATTTADAKFGTFLSR